METKAKVKVFGKEYIIKGDGNVEYLKKVAEYVDEKMKGIASLNKNLSEAKIAVLASLNIADEYLRLKQEYEKITKKALEKTKNLISMLDEGLMGTLE